MTYRLFYHPDIKKEDLPHIPCNITERIRRAIEQRLFSDPVRYGEPLKRGLKGYRKLRMGDYRVIYRIDKENIIILIIGNRKDVYDKVSLRL